ncbi:MAG: hypothetical protein ACP5NY_07880 [Thermocladium sp.]
MECDRPTINNGSCICDQECCMLYGCRGALLNDEQFQEEYLRKYGIRNIEKEKIRICRCDALNANSNICHTMAKIDPCTKEDHCTDRLDVCIAINNRVIIMIECKCGINGKRYYDSVKIEELIHKYLEKKQNVILVPKDYVEVFRKHIDKDYKNNVQVCKEC